jgi:hypothetical protein
MDYSDLSITIMPEACSRAMTLAMLSWLAFFSFSGV